MPLVSAQGTATRIQTEEQLPGTTAVLADHLQVAVIIKLPWKNAMVYSFKSNISHTLSHALLVFFVCVLSVPALAQVATDAERGACHFVLKPSLEEETGKLAREVPRDADSQRAEDLPAKRQAPPKKDIVEDAAHTAGGVILIGGSSLVGGAIGGIGTGLVSVVTGGAVIIILLPITLYLDVTSSLSGNEANARRNVFIGTTVVGALTTAIGATAGSALGASFALSLIRHEE